MKYFRVSYEEILWKRSWRNLVMLSATIPSYGDEKEEEVIVQDGINAAQLNALWG